jgi:hypothetical protein
MAEVKITCPNCFSEDRCFESKMEIEDFSSYMCFNCEGTKDNWSWKFASVRELSEEEQKDPKYEGNEFTLDIENARTFGQHEFLDACKKMGVIKDID